jgi:hypothetical protein
MSQAIFVHVNGLESELWCALYSFVLVTHPGQITEVAEHAMAKALKRDVAKLAGRV